MPTEALVRDIERLVEAVQDTCVGDVQAAAKPSETRDTARSPVEHMYELRFVGGGKHRSHG